MKNEEPKAGSETTGQQQTIPSPKLIRALADVEDAVICVHHIARFSERFAKAQLASECLAKAEADLGTEQFELLLEKLNACLSVDPVEIAAYRRIGETYEAYANSHFNEAGLVPETVGGQLFVLGGFHQDGFERLRFLRKERLSGYSNVALAMETALEEFEISRFGDLLQLSVDWSDKDVPWPVEVIEIIQDHRKTAAMLKAVAARYMT